MREERVDVDKRPVVYEEVSVGKSQVVQNEKLSDTVRREELRVGSRGDVNLADTAASSALGGTWDQVMPTYRQRWQQGAASSAGRWEDYEPGYRYGYESRSRPEYRGRRWADVESQVERDWSERNPSTPWTRLRDSIRETWDDASS